MELPSQILKQIAFNTRSNVEEHMLIVMEKTVHEENLFEPLQTNKRQFSTSITFLTAYNGIFIATTKKNILFF